ncbi:unannotated protein [freshwater metagenome]|uniref:Unannotated protein n=1 Tax=freshwater metagenome TaxID=449393 RepID=A0A6J7XUP8_9ZZZZ|nr:TSUP family transporter [Actinomycetota bacterium]
MLEFLLITVVGFAVGVINGMAGGASVISYPILLATGLSPVSAAVTNAIGVTPANFFALISIRGQIRAMFKEYAALIYISVVASIAGALLLLNMPPRIFEKIVPFLLFAATASLLVKVKPHRGKRHAIIDKVGIGASGFYCGYFGPGQGVLVIAVLARDASRNPKTLNAAKNLVVGVTSAVSNVVYFFSGQVNWALAAALLVGSTSGGTLGGRFASRVDPLVYKSLVLTVGFGASAWLFAKYLL